MPKSLIARARKCFFSDLQDTYTSLLNNYRAPSIIETRKTYRAVLSEPKLVVPDGDIVMDATHSVTEEETPSPLPISTSRSCFENLSSQ